jgi:methylase of polypeptide subunit release factors
VRPRLLVPILLIALAAVIPVGTVLMGQDKKDGKLAPYFPTPQTVVDQMLQLGEIKPGEKMWDLGSGDGRIVIAAARKFKADATGVELDEAL